MAKSKRSKPTSQQYLFVLRNPNRETARLAIRVLQEQGIRIISRDGDGICTGIATDLKKEAVDKTGLFSFVVKEGTRIRSTRGMDASQKAAVSAWNYSLSKQYKNLTRKRPMRRKKWTAKDKEPPGAGQLIIPEIFEKHFLKRLKMKKSAFLKKYRLPKGKKYEKLDGKKFVEYERKLSDRLNSPTAAYNLARLARIMGPEFQQAFLFIDIYILLEILQIFLVEPAEWKMENEISVGVIFVESSQNGGPKFSNSQRSTLVAEIQAGLNWLASEAPSGANLTWVYDWQYVTINVANGNNSSNESYWRNPAMGQVTYNGNTYSQNWNGMNDYREDMRVHNLSSHAIVIFVTPYGTEWHAYAGGHRVTLANRNNWGGWGINTIDTITAHELCHLFGAADEYTGSGTPCSSCSTTHGAYSIPNGNCGTCASPLQDCIMDQNDRRLCNYTRGHIGWGDFFVELTTSDVAWAGTDDTVWLDIGDRIINLDTSGHDDRERGNVEGYSLEYTGVVKSQIKRIGIRKSSDGAAGGWKLKRVRVWFHGELLLDQNNINQWLEDEYRWWASLSYLNPHNIVNKLRVDVTTADTMWAGTDDDVTLYIGGRSLNLDNHGHNDFERGNTDTFYLDPGVGLYTSMLSSIQIHKSPDGVAGGWKLKGLKIWVNNALVYNNQSINKWLEDSDRDWYGAV